MFFSYCIGEFNCHSAKCHFFLLLILCRIFVFNWSTIGHVFLNKKYKKKCAECRMSFMLHLTVYSKFLQDLFIMFTCSGFTLFCLICKSNSLITYVRKCEHFHLLDKCLGFAWTKMRQFCSKDQPKRLLKRYFFMWLLHHFHHLIKEKKRYDLWSNLTFKKIK